MPSITIFCSSSDKVSPMFFSEMELLATGIAKMGIEIIYGGAKVGLMGHMANRALTAGGKVTGVIPEYLNKPEIVHSGLSELVIVGNLMDRKRKMAAMGDLILAFPGGLGTIDEVTEILALKQLGEINKPVFFLNFLDFWSPFFDYLTLLQQQGMIHQTLDELFGVFPSHQGMLKYLETHFSKTKSKAWHQ